MTRGGGGTPSTNKALSVHPCRGGGGAQRLSRGRTKGAQGNTVDGGQAWNSMKCETFGLRLQPTFIWFEKLVSKSLRAGGFGLRLMEKGAASKTAPATAGDPP